MGRLYVPRHSATHRFCYIWGADPAWKQDQITTEIREAETARERALERAKEAEERGEPAPEDPFEGLDDPNRHPVRVYYSGETRYDISALIPWGGTDRTVKDYLEDGYVVWEIERLREEEMVRVTDMFGTLHRKQDSETISPEDAAATWIMRRCCVNGLVGVQGLPDLPFQRVGGRVTSETMDMIHDVGTTQGIGMGVNLIRSIGQAVYRASNRLTDAEKKR